MASLVATQPSDDQKTFNLRDLPKSNTFTSKLPADEAYPTPAASHKAERSKLGPRLVKNAAYTFVRPDHIARPEVLGVSKAALKDLAIDPAVIDTKEFKDVLSGNKIITLEDDQEPGDKDIYPWAQCYGGFQFGQWAGQLGDGRAISLFETTNPATGKRYEVQLKGAGRTPYSRFADGKAVLRSSIREFVVSESLHALGIPTTRALSLILAPEARIRREMTEPGAIVCRFAESWLRIGTFDLARSRGDRDLIRKLADYIGDEVIPWNTLPAKIDTQNESDVLNPPRNVAKEDFQGSAEKPEQQQNRYMRLYREIVRRNAKSVAAWQSYAFTNGVLNTDNTSIFGLSIDYGPFAFLDNFDPNYTPNHDDHMLRYAYKNQPSIIWWNMVRLGESFGELIGAGDKVDTEHFKNEGVTDDMMDEVVKRGQHAINESVSEEFQKVFTAEYKRIMITRLGLKTVKDGDLDGLVSGFLGFLESLELDFNHAFKRLSSVSWEEIDTEEKRKDVAGRFFHHEGLSGLVSDSEEDARAKIAKWLEKWSARSKEDWEDSAEAKEQRIKAMKSVNPNFVPRSWILDEVIDRVEKKGDREILSHIMEMALNPFKEEWGWNKEEEARFCGDVPKYQRAMQCSCSS